MADVFICPIRKVGGDRVDGVEIQDTPIDMVSLLSSPFAIPDSCPMENGKGGN